MESTGFGAAGVRWQEIQAWSELTGHDLTAGEASALCVLSREYAAELSLSSSPDRLPPWEDVHGEAKRIASEQLGKILDGMIAQREKKK